MRRIPCERSNVEMGLSAQYNIQYIIFYAAKRKCLLTQKYLIEYTIILDKMCIQRLATQLLFVVNMKEMSGYKRRGKVELVTVRLRIYGGSN